MMHAGASSFGRAAIFWSSVAGSTVFYSTLIMAIAPFSKALDPKKHKLHNLAAAWARTIFKLNPWWKVDIEGRENVAALGEAVIYVANHQSQSDILAAFLLDGQFRWLSKASMFKVPWLGWAMKAVGYVPITRGDRSSHLQSMQASKDHLANGIPMFFFPEGTRSRDGIVAPFKPGAFKLAKETGSAIVPVTILGTQALLPKGSVVPRSSSIKLIVHPRIDPQGRSADELAKLARTAIVSALPADLRGEART